MESRFFEPLILRTPRFFEPWHLSLGFASVKHCNLTPDFSNLRFFETPDISYQFLPPVEEIYKKFTFDFSNRRKVLLSSVQSHFRSLFSYSKGRTTLYYTGNSTKKSTAQCLSFEWSLMLIMCTRWLQLSSLE